MIDRLQQFDEQLVVDKEDFSTPTIEVQFFPVDKLLQLDPQFAFPGYGFDTGQFVVTTGCIAKADFGELLDWEQRSVKHPEVFQKGEQGVFNYVVLRKVQQQQLTLHREPFMVWPGEASRAQHSPGRLHGLVWGRPLKEMPRSEILLHFENLYYARIPSGWIRRRRRVNRWAKRVLVTPLKRLVTTLWGRG